LDVFSEASVDPMNKPLCVLTRKQVEDPATLRELLTFAKEELNKIQVKFISEQSQKDRLLLSEARTNEGAIGVGSAFSISTRASMSTQDFDEEEPTFSMCPCSWINCGGVGCGCSCCSQEDKEDDPAPTFFPRFTQVLCGRIEFISKTHIWLMLGLAGCIGISVALAHNLFYLPDKDGFFGSFRGFSLILFVGYLLPIIMVLANFENIDAVRNLKKDIGKLEEESNNLRNKREQMTGFWGKVNVLTDIWVNRTAPRLDLLKEVHVNFEMIRDPKELSEELREATDLFDELEQVLPVMELWQDSDAPGSTLTSVTKKAFARVIRRCYERATNLTSMLKNLRDVLDKEAENLFGQYSAKKKEADKEDSSCSIFGCAKQKSDKEYGLPTETSTASADW